MDFLLKFYLNHFKSCRFLSNMKLSLFLIFTADVGEFKDVEYVEECDC
jgi:hypothetical protein